MDAIGSHAVARMHALVRVNLHVLALFLFVVSDDSDGSESEDDDDADENGGVSQAWKSGMATRAAERFLQRKSQNVNLQDLVYGRPGRDGQDNAAKVHGCCMLVVVVRGCGC